METQAGLVHSMKVLKRRKKPCQARVPWQGCLSLSVKIKDLIRIQILSNGLIGYKP
jgi:hypothetical protein